MYWASVKFYAQAVGKAWWALFVGSVLGVIGGTGLIWHVDLKFPLWLWFLAAVVCLSVAQFLAFHRVRVERDSAIARAEQAEGNQGPSAVRMQGPGVHSNVFSNFRVFLGQPPPKAPPPKAEPNERGKK